MTVAINSITTDVPMGWAACAPLPFEGTAAVPDFDTAPRLLVGKRASTELVQLCGIWSPERHPADTIVDPKINGHRAAYLGFGGDDETILSRGGTRMGCAAYSLPALRWLQRRFGEAMMFDAEWVVPGDLKATNAAFKRNKPVVTGCMWIFDAIPLRDWIKGRCDTPLRERRASLARAFGTDPLCRSVGLVQGFGLDAGQTMAMAEGLWRRQFEGLVIKDAAAGYARGRNNAFLKLTQETNPCA